MSCKVDRRPWGWFTPWVRLLGYLPPHALPLIGRGETFERTNAAMLFSDIAGFTALTRRLAQRGRAGAEELAVVVNQAFHPAVGAISKQGGSIVSFGGDALFSAYFGAGAVARATAAARELADQFAEFSHRTSEGTIRLTLSQAVHRGLLQTSIVDLGDHRHCVVHSPAASRLVRMHDDAAVGFVLVSDRAQSASDDAGEPFGQGTPTELSAFVPTSLRPWLDRFDGQFRETTVLFIETANQRQHAIKAFAQELGATLARYQGVLLKTDVSTHGVKWLCVFGLPVTREDDTERALAAALHLRGKTNVRAGVASGLTVNLRVGTDERWTFDVLGDAVNLAARVLDSAGWGQAWTTDRVLQSEPRIEGTPRAAHTLKGIDGAVTLAELTGLRSARTQAPRTACVGRSRELSLARAALVRAAAGGGRTLFVSGEAGMGKSRLAFELRGIASSCGFDVFTAAAVAFAGETERPPIRIVQDAIGDAKVEDEARRVGLADTDIEALLEALGLRPFDETRAGARNAHWLAIRSYLLARSKVRPQLFIFEDMHWADEATREITALLAAASGHCCTILLTSRPSNPPPPGAELVALTELQRDAIAEIVSQHVGGAAPPQLVELVTDKCGGNPFYIEELIRHFREIGVLSPTAAWLRDPRPDELPDSLERLVAARIDRLSGKALRTIQLCSVIGRRAPTPLLQTAVTDLSPMKELETQGLVFHHGSDDCFVFKHSITRDVAYASMLSGPRRELHRTVGEAIEALPAGHALRSEEAMSHHFFEAGEHLRAYPHCIEAAVQARATFDLDVATTQYGRALEIAEANGTPLTALLTDIGHVSYLAGDYFSAEVALERARNEEALAPLANARLLKRLAEVSLRAGLYDVAIARCDEAVALAENDAALVATLEAIAAQAHIAIGDETHALVRVQRGLEELGEGARGEEHTLLILTRGSVRFGLGQHENAEADFTEAAQLALDEADQWQHCRALLGRSETRVALGDLQGADEDARAVMQNRAGAADRIVRAEALRCKALVAFGSGKLADADGSAREAIALVEPLQDHRSLALLLSLSAKIAFASKRPEAALQACEAAADHARQIGYVPALAEIERTMQAVRS